VSTTCPVCGRETLDDEIMCGHPVCRAEQRNAQVPQALHMAAASVGAKFSRSIGDGPTPVAVIPPRGFFSYQEYVSGGGRDIDDQALILSRLGYEVDLVQVQEQGGCRLRDRKTGQWFVVEEGTGNVFLVSTHPLLGAP
jgi:hypothetical protein